MSQGVPAARKCLWESVLDEAVLSCTTAQTLLFPNSTHGSPITIKTAMALVAEPGGMRYWELLSASGFVLLWEDHLVRIALLLNFRGGAEFGFAAAGYKRHL